MMSLLEAALVLQQTANIYTEQTRRQQGFQAKQVQIV